MESTSVRKVCKGCSHDKDGSEFYQHKRASGKGYCLSQLCKVCHCIESAKNHAAKMADPEARKHLRELHILANQRRAKEGYFTDWASKNHDRVLAKQLAWAKANPDKVKATRARHRQVVKDAAIAGDPWGIQRTLKKQMCDSVSSKLRNRGKSKRGRTFDHLPYTAEELRRHIESKFLPGMTWANRGTEWELDHVIPDYEFEYSSMDDPGFLQSWALENLQPLWASDNAKKWRHLPSEWKPAGMSA
jgi:hypothetical protein